MDLRFLDAIRTLTLCDIQVEKNKLNEQLSAIECLRLAPDDEIYQQGLLQALRSSNEVVVTAATLASIERFKRLPEDSELIDRIMLKMLDTCFLDLVGQTRTSTGQQNAKNAAALLNAIAQFLEEHPLQYEHHRSRLLARARQVQYIDGTKIFANAVVDFQKKLGEGKRSDNFVANELHHLRKYEAYSTESTKEATLLSYLRSDRHISLMQTDEYLFSSYKALLNIQNKESSRQAILFAFDNLIKWAKEIPQAGEAFQPLFQDVVERPHSIIRWKERNQQVMHYLQLHRQLLPGQNQVGDVFELLKTKYDADKSEDILIKGVQLLQNLPLMRHRSKELCGFILLPSRRGRSLEVWKALLTLVGKLVSGLADFKVSDEKESTPIEESRNKLLRRNKFLKKVLEHDALFRKLLQQISFDQSLILHDSETVAANIREQAWRTLLRCLPYERKALYAEGLQANNRVFFVATLEEAANHGQRMLWPLLAKNWHIIVDVSQPKVQRQQYLYAVCDYFERTRNYEAVQSNGNQTAPLIALALDDQDEAARHYAEQAIIKAGYKLELEKEQQRREILRLSDEITASNDRIIEAEKKQRALSLQSIDAQTEHSQTILQVQDLQQQQETLVTAGFITTANQEVSLARIRENLERTLEEAEQQLSILRGLTDRISTVLSESKELHGTMESLVQRQRYYESKINNLEKNIENCNRRIRDAVDQANRAQNNLNNAERELNSLYPPVASNENYDQENSKYLNKKKKLDSNIRNYRSKIDGAERTQNDQRRSIENHRNQIRNNEREINRLRQEINQLRTSIKEIENRVGSLRREYSERRVTWESLQRKVSELRSQMNQMEHQFQQENQATQTRHRSVMQQLQQQQNQLQKIQQNMQNLSHKINSNNDYLEKQKIHNQRLGQALDSGYQHSHDIASQAIPSSSQSDHEAFSLELQLETLILQEQEGNVIFNTKIQQFLDDKLKAQQGSRSAPQHSSPKSAKVNA